MDMALHGVQALGGLVAIHGIAALLEASVAQSEGRAPEVPLMFSLSLTAWAVVWILVPILFPVTILHVVATVGTKRAPTHS